MANYTGTIRVGVVEDATALAALAERTFRETFQEANQMDDMNAHCALSYSPEIQARELGDPLVQTLVVEDADAALMAYAQLRPRGVPHAPALPSPIELWRFYVDRAHHGRGVAQALMEAVVAAAREQGAETLWLGVWEHNPRAQAFYRKAGFTDVGAHQFRLGADIQTDRLMARSLAAS